jgi:sigma-E factor negative regulatory protein RseC
MNTTTGTVLSVATHAAGKRAWIAIDSGIHCSRCAAGKGCGAGLIGSRARPRRVVVVVPTGTELDKGDSVTVMLEPGNVLHAAWIVYGWPLLGAICGAGGSWLITDNDALAAMAALAGLAIGYLVAKLKLRQQGCVNRFALKIVA